MGFLILLILVIITSESFALFGIFLESNCNSGRNCQPVTKRECASPPCFLFFGKYKTTTISQGRCINFDNGPSCSGNNCIIRRCVECYTGSHCWQQGNGLTCEQNLCKTYADRNI